MQVLPDSPVNNADCTQSPTDQRKLHFLKRALFGVPVKDFIELKDLSLEETIRKTIVSSSSLPHLPLKDYTFIYSEHSDWKVSYMETWIYDLNYHKDVNIKRKNSIQKWVAGLLLENGLTIQPKMFLFWSNFFSVELERLSHFKMGFNYYSQLYLHCLENFRDLLVQLILNKSLNHYSKKIKEPKHTANQFLGHLILSEYTIGENYLLLLSKEKQKKLYRLLNKWDSLSDDLLRHSRNSDSAQLFEIEAFSDKSVVKEFTQELSHFLGTLLQNQCVAVNIAKKLFNWFLHSEIDAEAMKKIVLPSAEKFYADKYEIKSLLEAFFSNPHFCDERYYGSTIKSPIDFLSGLLTQFSIYSKPQADAGADYHYWGWIKLKLSQLGQDVCDPPGYKGWPQYYLEPYGHQWISNEPLMLRHQIIDKLLNGKYQVHRNVSLKIDCIEFIKSIPGAADPDHLIDFLQVYLLGNTCNQKTSYGLKCYFLLDKTEDNEVWTKKYHYLIENSANDTMSLAIAASLKKLLYFLLTQPEYQLS